METVAQKAVLVPHAVQHQIVKSLALKYLMDFSCVCLQEILTKWLGDRDSNPDRMVQSHLSYR